MEMDVDHDSAEEEAEAPASGAQAEADRVHNHMYSDPFEKRWPNRAYQLISRVANDLHLGDSDTKLLLDVFRELCTECLVPSSVADLRDAEASVFGTVGYTTLRISDHLPGLCDVCDWFSRLQHL